MGETQRQSGSERRRRVEGGRGKAVLVRLTDEELELLQAKAIRYNVSVPKLLVDAALSTAAEVALDNAATRAEVLAQLFNSQRFLASIANNVNQIARATNAAGSLPPSLESDLQHSLRRARESVVALEAFLADFSKAWPR